METLSGEDLVAALSSAVNCLEQYRDVINALNVFPVPDGDTGTNMLLTMRAGLEACGDPAHGGLGSVCAGMADGLFLGARGNSGVILSQFFKGFFGPLLDQEACGPPDLVTAFQQATEAAYRAVGKPVEGTMLTVIKAMSEPVQDQNQAADVGTVWERAFDRAKAALALTPSQLPVLAEAGVVDAGGMGIVAIIAGIWSQLGGPDLETMDLGFDLRQTGAPTLGQDFINASHEATWGYCTQFLIRGEGLFLDQIRDDMGMVAESVVVVGDEDRVRVHVHALDPGSALSYAVSLGQLSQIKIENMSQQNRDWSGDAYPETNPPTEVALVAVVPGAGFEKLFRESGCASVISGGQTMNPSVQQILDAAGESGGIAVIVLPNNRNIVVAAEQAAQGGPAGDSSGNSGPASLHVAPTVSVPQGVAAALAFNPVDSIEHNLQAMNAAIQGLVTIEVTQAVRDSDLDGISVEAGQFIGLVDGKMVVAGQTAEAVLLEALATQSPTDARTVTLFWGMDSSQEKCNEVAAEIEREVPGIQVDSIFGGQPHYPYLASVD